MRIVILLLLLAACQRQSLEFSGVTPVATKLSGDNILVFRKGNRAQAIRINARNKSARTGAVDRLVLAIEQVSECKVRTRGLKGDDVLITATLTCLKN